MKFLLNVGAEKCGTTWLYEYFKHHPEFYDNGKELNVIQRDDLVPTFTPDKGYKANIQTYFKDISNINQVTGDFTHYEGSTENIFRILKDGFRQYDIDIVPVYIMREPIQRAWSAWNMLGGDYDFDMPNPADFLTRNYLDCKYKETIKALDNVFPEPLYFFYEDFFKQTDIDTICDKLEINHHPILQGKVNVGKYIRQIPKDFIDRFGYTQKNIQAMKYIEERFSNVPWAYS